MMKRFGSIVLVAAMVIMMLPFTAMAEPVSEITGTGYYVLNNDGDAFSGKYGTYEDACDNLDGGQAIVVYDDDVTIDAVPPVRIVVIDAKLTVDPGVAIETGPLPLTMGSGTIILSAYPGFTAPSGGTFTAQTLVAAGPILPGEPFGGVPIAVTTPITPADVVAAIDASRGTHLTLTGGSFSAPGNFEWYSKDWLTVSSTASLVIGGNLMNKGKIDGAGPVTVTGQIDNRDEFGATVGANVLRGVVPIAPGGASVPAGSGNSLTFTLDLDFDAFQDLDLYYNGQMLVRGVDYIVERGSVRIILLPTFLNTLSSGAQGITAVLPTGHQVPLNFSVTNSATGGSPGNFWASPADSSPTDADAKQNPAMGGK